MKNSISPFTVDYVKKHVDLSEFMEVHAGCQLKWTIKGESAKTICPMPYHKDSKPSFYINVTSDNVWLYNCFGCGSSGTIIDFCMDFYGLDNYAESVSFICNKFGFKANKEIAVSALKNVAKKVDFNKRMEYTHIITANQCRMLLRKNYDEHFKWVGDAYRTLNKALNDSDIETIEKINSEAFKRMSSYNGKR